MEYHRTGNLEKNTIVVDGYSKFTGKTLHTLKVLVYIDGLQVGSSQYKPGSVFYVQPGIHTVQFRVINETLGVDGQVEAVQVRINDNNAFFVVCADYSGTPWSCKIKQFDRREDYNNFLDTIDEEVKETQAAAAASGCYVATAVYGSYDCPQVWTLRRFRDCTLAQTWYGRAFIRTYYAISPTLVKWFGDTQWFKNMWRGKLDRMVKKLQSEGVESTPYEDRTW